MICMLIHKFISKPIFQISMNSFLLCKVICCPVHGTNFILAFFSPMQASTTATCKLTEIKYISTCIANLVQFSSLWNAYQFISSWSFTNLLLEVKCYHIMLALIIFSRRDLQVFNTGIIKTLCTVYYFQPRFY